MALRAGAIRAADAYASIIRQAIATKKYAQDKKAEFQGATVSADQVIAVIQHAAAVLPRFASWTSAPGLEQYARDQEADQAYDVVAEYTAMRNTIRDLRDSLIALFPKDGAGYLLYQKLNADGTFAMRTFTAAQMSATLALFDAVDASITLT